MISGVVCVARMEKVMGPPILDASDLSWDSIPDPITGLSFVKVIPNEIMAWGKYLRIFLRS